VVVWTLISETERRAKIIDYIWKKSLDEDPKITKSSIMKDFKDSRPMTTYQITIDLLKEGKLKMVKPKDKPYSQIDYLVINENDEFNKIYNMFLEIENIIDIIDQPINEFRKRKPVSPLDSSNFDHDLANEFHSLLEDLIGTFEEAMPILIQELLPRINRKIHLQIDKQILKSRIIELYQKFMIHVGSEQTANQKLDSIILRLGHIDPKAPYLARIKKIDPILLNDSQQVALKFIRVLENFKNQFLSEQKTTEPHEKSD